jgi:hypothetical protein
MNLMRQLEANHKSLWDELSPPKDEMATASDCDPALLSGWTDRDISLWDVSGVDGKPSLKDILVALCRNKKKIGIRSAIFYFQKKRFHQASSS